MPLVPPGSYAYESSSQTRGTALAQWARCIIIRSKNLLYGKRHRASRIALSNPSRQAATMERKVLLLISVAFERA